MVDIVTRLGKGSPLTNAEVDANFTNLAEVSGVTGEPMGHEDRTTSTISFNASTRTFTIAPVASSFTVWCKGKKVVISTAQTVTIPNTTGMYSIYYDANGVLSAKSGYFTFSLEAPTAYVYWNATTSTCPYFGDERHGVVLDWQTHEYLHRTRGAALASGFAASGYVLGGNGSSNSHAQITLDGGTFFDEDMKIIVTATNTPTAGTWEQDLLSPARIPVLYLSGTAWVIDSPTDYPLKQGTARPQYNAYSGGVWSTADVTNNKYATTWILATNNLTYPVIAIIGQAQNDSQSAAEAVDFTELQLPGFPSVEFRPLYKLIFQCADSCTNAVHASLVSITDIRSIAAAGTAASIVTDHGNLSGLSDDDHPQYIHVDTLRTVSAAVKASFLPSQTSNAGKFLQTDGTATSWQALTSGNVTTALGFTPYNATNPSGYISGITSGMVTTALGFTPYNATNPSGYVTAAGARGAISVTGAGSYDSATGVINIVGGLTSFNTRTGAITLSSADVTTALGFTPYNNTNPSGYITGITSTMVTTALGFTPYNSSNPNGYISSITSANVTTALGFTPYNSTNPSGYITSSALSGYLTSASAASTYLTDAMRNRGSVAVANIDTATLDGFYTQNNAGDSDGLLVFNPGGSLGPFQLHAKYTGLLRFRNKTDSNTWTGWKTVIHDGNYSSYTMPLSGGATWGMSYFDFSQSSVSLRITSGPGTFYIGDDDIANLASGALVATPSSRVSSGTAHLSTYAYGVSQGDNRTHFGYNSGGTYVNYIRGAATYFDSGTLQVAGSQVLHAGNYNSYAPTLTGGGASGTWSINVTGSANSANTLASGATINGTAYFRKNQTAGDYTTASLWTESYGNTSTGIAFHISGVAGRYLEMRNNSANLFWNGSVILNDGNYRSFDGTLRALGNGDGMNLNTLNYNSMYFGYIENSANKPGSYSYAYGTILTFDPGQGSGGRAQFYISHAGNDLIFRGGWNGNDSWQTWNRVLTNQNYNSYSPTLTGGNASGTWGINVTGTAGSISGFNNPTTAPTANTIAYRDSAGDISAREIVLSSALQSAVPTVLVGMFPTTNQLVRMTPAAVASAIQTGASGTWSITATSANKTNANSGYARVGYGMAPFYNWGGANAGAGAPSDSTYTTGIDVGSHPSDQAYGFQIASNMWNVGLWTRTYNSGFSGWVRLLDSSNYTSYALPISGGTLTGSRPIFLDTNGGSITSTGNVGGWSMGHLFYGSSGTYRGGWGALGGANDLTYYWVGQDYNDATMYVYPGSRVKVQRDLLVNGRTGGNYGNRIIVGADDTVYTLQDTNVRPTIQIHGQYPVLSLNHTVTSNTNHGPTIQFTCNGTGNQFVIGTGGSGAQLDMGYSANTDWNPHNGIAGYSGTTFFRAMTNGYIGLGAPGDWGALGGGDPGYHLHFKGFNNAPGSHAAVFQNTVDGANNGAGFLFQNSFGNHSWGIVAEYRISGAGDRPSILFSSGATSTTWSVGYGAADDQFRINQNHGHRNGGWGTERFRIDTGGTSYFNGNVALHAGNFTSYAAAASHTQSVTTLSDRPSWFGGGSFIASHNNANEWRNSGFYENDGGGSNWPSNGTWYNSINVRHSNQGNYHGFQVAMSYYDNNFWFRSYQGGGTFQSWAVALSSQNYSSYAINRGGDTVSSIIYYLSNRNTSSDSCPLQAFSNNGSGATMSFHRGGYYATNFGLDSDNVMRIGGWSAATNRWQLDMSGNMTVAGNVTAYSDERLKKDWSPVRSDFVEVLATIKSGTYTRIDSEERQAGVSAQDFQNLLPETVSEDNEGTLSLAYGNAALVSAVELAKDNVELRARIERLESLINKLIGD